LKKESEIAWKCKNASIYKEKMKIKLKPDAIFKKRC